MEEEDDLDEAFAEAELELRVEKYCDSVRNNTNFKAVHGPYSLYSGIPCSCKQPWDFGQNHEVQCRRLKEQPYVRLPDERGGDES